MIQVPALRPMVLSREGLFWALVIAPGLPFVVLNLSYRRILAQKITEVGARLSSEMKSLYAKAYGDPSYRESLEQFYNWRTYVAPVVLTWVAASVFVLLGAAKYLHLPLPLEGVSAGGFEVRTTVLAGAGGAYLWGLYDLLRRHGSADLSSTALHFTWFRIALAGAIGCLLGDSALDAWLAFALGSLPIPNIWKWLRGRARLAQWSTRREKPGLDDPPQLSELAGMTEDVQQRLYEEEIDSVQHLAFADPVRLLFRTNLEWNVILDFIDQAMLVNYVGRRIAELRPLGVRGAIDLAAAYYLAAGRYAEAPPRAESSKTQAVGSNAPPLAQLIGATAPKSGNDEWEPTLEDQRAACAVLKKVGEKLGGDESTARNLAFQLAEDPLVDFVWEHWDAAYPGDDDDPLVTESERKAIEKLKPVREAIDKDLRTWIEETRTSFARARRDLAVLELVVLAAMLAITVAPHGPTLMVAAATGAVALAGICAIAEIIQFGRRQGKPAPLPDERETSWDTPPFPKWARELKAAAVAFALGMSAAVYLVANPRSVPAYWLFACALLLVVVLRVGLRWLWYELAGDYGRTIRRAQTTLRNQWRISRERELGIIDDDVSLALRVRAMATALRGGALK